MRLEGLLGIRRTGVTYTEDLVDNAGSYKERILVVEGGSDATLPSKAHYHSYRWAAIFDEWGHRHPWLIRPFVSLKTIQENIELAKSHDVVDTVVRLDGYHCSKLGQYLYHGYSWTTPLSEIQARKPSNEDFLALYDLSINKKKSWQIPTLSLSSMVKLHLQREYSIKLRQYRFENCTRYDWGRINMLNQISADSAEKYHHQIPRRQAVETRL